MDDFTGLISSPLAKSIPVALVIGLLAWLVTEVGSFVVPTKWRPALALVAGVAMGYLCDRAGLLDFGAGPDGRFRALVLGLIGGALAPVAHERLKSVPPFSWLTTVTPTEPAKPPTGGGE